MQTYIHFLAFLPSCISHPLSNDIKSGLHQVTEVIPLHTHTDRCNHADSLEGSKVDARWHLWAIITFQKWINEISSHLVGWCLLSELWSFALSHGKMVAGKRRGQAWWFTLVWSTSIQAHNNSHAHTRKYTHTLFLTTHFTCMCWKWKDNIFPSSNCSQYPIHAFLLASCLS